MMAVRFSDLRPGRPLPPAIFLVFFSLRGGIGLKAILRLEGLKNPVISGIEPTTFRVVAECLNEILACPEIECITSSIQINIFAYMTTGR
jgi:hypothetical protein